MASNTGLDLGSTDTMQYNPFMLVKRLIIENRSGVVYDEVFHKGINVLRGENSSGKSTILNLLFYGLGGDLFAWSDAAKLCDRVIVEVELNGKLATLRRPISQLPRREMDIFGGAYELAAEAPISEWIRYPYARTAEKESFSQAIFRLLGIPEASSELSGNITIHQILRILYSDQLSPVENLFRFEQFDSPAMRDAVGRLLCGAFDAELYSNQARIKLLNRDFDSAKSQLTTFFSFFRNQSHSLTIEWLNAEKSNLEQQMSEVRKRIAQLSEEMGHSKNTSTISIDLQKSTYRRLVDAQRALSIFSEQVETLKLAIEDSGLFIDSLKKKLEALEDAKLVSAEIGQVHFMFCPSCYSEIQTHAEGTCHLCKEPVSPDNAAKQIAGLINNLAIQIKQSETVRSHRIEQFNQLIKQEPKIMSDWQSAAADYEQIRGTPLTEQQAKVNELNRKLGYLEREMKALDEKAWHVSEVARLSKVKSDLDTEIKRLEARNKALIASQEERLSQGYTSISEETRLILLRDLRRQDAFEVAKHVWFEFGQNRITVDDQEYFSASSRVILKNAFFIGFLSAAMKKPFFRHPRFCIIDTIEDKGIEPIRSHNFQNLIRQMSDDAMVDHQIILATANISPDLESEEYTIGRYYTRDNPALAVTL